MPHKITFRQRLRYRFDNLMARGAGAQMLLLAVASLVLVLFTALVVAGLGAAPDEDGAKTSFLRVAWSSLMRTLDAGNMADDRGSYVFVGMMLCSCCRRSSASSTARSATSLTLAQRQELGGRKRAHGDLGFLGRRSTIVCSRATKSSRSAKTMTRW